MKDKDIKYIVAVNSFSNPNNPVKYDSPYGIIWILSKNSETYTLKSSEYGDAAQILFFNIRENARRHRIITPFNEFVIKVRVKNNRIIEWIKKNP